MLNKTLDIYNKILKRQKIENSQWAFWCKQKKTNKEKEEVIIEAILTQQTNWNNVQKAMVNLKKAKKNSLRAINNTSLAKIQILIKPSGFYRLKAKYLKNLANFFIVNGGIKNLEKIPTDILRKKLLEINGVGNETADSILLYVFNRPIFVVDAYTKKWIKEFNLPVKNFSYIYLQKFFMKQLPKKTSFYQQFHAKIVLYYKNNNQ